MNMRIYSYDIFDPNEDPNIFLLKFDMNENLNKYSDQKYSNFQIYLSHSGIDWHQFCAFTN